MTELDHHFHLNSFSSNFLFLVRRARDSNPGTCRARNRPRYALLVSLPWSIIIEALIDDLIMNNINSPFHSPTSYLRCVVHCGWDAFIGAILLNHYFHKLIYRKMWLLLWCFLCLVWSHESLRACENIESNIDNFRPMSSFHFTNLFHGKGFSKQILPCINKR